MVLRIKGVDMKDKCLEIKHLYCLDYFWYKELTREQKNWLNSNLEKSVINYINTPNNKCFRDSMIRPEKSHGKGNGVLCITPQGGQTNQRLVSIMDPRINQKGLVCVYYAPNHVTEKDRINKAKDLYVDSKKIFNTTNLTDKEKEKELAKNVNRLVVIGFINIAFNHRDKNVIDKETQNLLNKEQIEDINEKFSKWFHYIFAEYAKSFEEDYRINEAKKLKESLCKIYGDEWEDLLNEDNKRNLDALCSRYL